MSDGTERLALALYGRPATARDYIGGSEAKMLHDAADELRAERDKYTTLLFRARAYQEELEQERARRKCYRDALIGLYNAIFDWLPEHYGNSLEDAFSDAEDLFMRESIEESDPVHAEHEG